MDVSYFEKKRRMDNDRDKLFGNDLEHNVLYNIQNQSMGTLETTLNTKLQDKLAPKASKEYQTVYKTSVGVIPFRKSQEISDFRIIMKGRGLDVHQNDPQKIIQPSYDDYQTESNDRFKMNNNQEQHENIVHRFPPKKTLPAILPSRGTADVVKLSERPKPVKNKKSDYTGVRKKIKIKNKLDFNDNNESDPVGLREENLELDYVKNLVREAQEISSYKYVLIDDSEYPPRKPVTEQRKNKDVFEHEEKNVTSQNTKEKELLRSVEGLVMAIKSGKLLHEQEMSDKQIQSILDRVLEKDERHEVTVKEVFSSESGGTVGFNEFADNKPDTASNENKSTDELEVVESVKNTEKTVEDSTESSKYSKYPSPDNSVKKHIENEPTYKTNFVYRMDKNEDDDDDELETLMNLPNFVTNEDIISINSKRLQIPINEALKKSKTEKHEKEKQHNVKNQRNTHLFCMYNETDSNALLPAPLLHVTRKITVKIIKQKYEFRCASCLLKVKKFVFLKKMVLSEEPIEDENENEISKLESIMRSKRAADRVIKNSYQSKEIFSDLSKFLSMNRMPEDFVLDATKLKVHECQDSDEYDLYFIRPSPPKMMIRTSFVQKNLFPQYVSNKFLIDNKMLFKEESKSEMSTFSSSVEHQTENDANDENLFQAKLTSEKLIHRMYNSVTDLSKHSSEEFPMVFQNARRNSFSGINTDSTPFMHIEADYNDAIEEAGHQKDNVKKKQKNQTVFEVGGTHEEVDKIMEENFGDFKETTLSDTPVRNVKPMRYFLKDNEITPAELALKKGRQYVEKELPIRRKQKTAKNGFKGTNKKMVKDVEAFLQNLNTRENMLHRTDSLDGLRINKTYFEEELRVPKIKRKNSLPDFMDFEEFLSRNCSDPDSVEDKRDFVRKLWNVWFDETIPPLNGNLDNNELKENNENSEAISDVDQNSASQNEKPKENFDSYSQIEFSVSIDSPQMKVVVELEKEINILTEKIEKKLDAFSLTRRGALYRKLGYLKLAMNDLNQAIEVEPRYVDAFWHRHLIFLTQNELDKALDDLNYILKVNKNHAGAYLSRGDIYAERGDISLAIVNYSQAVKYNPNQYQAYYKRAKMYELRGDLRMAMDDYLTTTKLNPKIVDAWFKHGMSYYNSNNWQYAIVDFTELLKHNPNQSEARLYRGKCYLYLKEYQLAMNDFSIAIHLDPNNWQAYYHRGTLLRKLDKEQSMKDLSISIMIENSYDNINAYLHRAISYYENKNYEEAIKDYENILLLDKEFSPAYVNLGIIYMSIMSNFWKAIKCFNLAIKSNPTYIRAYMCRAQAYKKIHNLKQAYLDYTRAIHLAPLNTQTYIFRGQIVLEMGNLKLAAFCVQHAAFLNEGNLKNSKNDLLPVNEVKTNEDQAVTQKAVVYSFLKQFSKAFTVLENELKLRPSRKTYNLLGKIHMESKSWQDAADIFQKAINYNKISIGDQQKSSYSNMKNAKAQQDNENDLVESYFMKGRCSIELLNYNEALQCFQKVIEMRPSNPEAFFYRGLVRVQLRQPNCIQDFNRALAINPSFFESYLARAAIYGLQDRHAKAILNCNEALKINIKCVRGFLYRGALKFYSKSYSNAVYDFTEAIKLHPTCSLAYYNRALAFEKQKNFSHALKDYSIVLLLGDYLKFKVCINRGLLYYGLNDFVNALNDFKIASELSPTDYKIKHIIGLCFHKLGALDEAIKVLTSTLDVNNKYNNALVSRGNVYVDFGNEYGFKKASKDYSLALLKNPVDIDARCNLAYLSQMQNRFKKAWMLFSSLITLYPNLSAAYEGRSIVCLQMSDMNAAMKDINLAIKLKRSAEHFVNRGVINQFLGDNINAMRDYQTALLIDSNCALALYNSGNVFLHHKQYKQALQYYDNAIQKAKLEDETVYHNRGIAKALMNLNVEAFNDFTKALSFNRYAAYIYMSRSLLLTKLKDYVNAEKDLTTAIDLDNSDSLLYKLRANCRSKLLMRTEAIEDFKIAVQLEENNNK